MASSTVPSADTPKPANNAKTLLISDNVDYRRPTAGGNAAGMAGDAPAGPTPDYSISMPGGAPSAGGTQVGPDMGHGATQVGPSGDRPSGGDRPQGGGTVSGS